VVEAVPDAGGFSVSAAPFPTDSQWALDRDYLTEWNADVGLESRAYLEFHYPIAVLTQSLKIVLPAGQAEPEIRFLESDNQWHELIPSSVDREEVKADLRPQLADQFRRLGFRYIAITVPEGSKIQWAKDFMGHPETWGFHLVGGTQDDLLYEVSGR
jgi:hypothetical protein